MSWKNVVNALRNLPEDQRKLANNGLYFSELGMCAVAAVFPAAKPFLNRTGLDGLPIEQILRRRGNLMELATASGFTFLELVRLQRTNDCFWSENTPNSPEDQKARYKYCLSLAEEAQKEEEAL